MKKILIFLAVIIVLFSGVAILTNMQNSEKAEDNPYGKDKLHPDTIALLQDENYQNLILPDELELKLENKEDMTVYYFQSSCEYCKVATPILSPLAEDMGIDLVQYNLQEFEQGWNEFGIEGTPTIVQFKDGKEVARIANLRDETEYRQWFTENSQ
jgi:thiol-disulfide isomerase/thioredoxin